VIALWAFWAILNTPSKFEGDPYGGFLNQWSHCTVSAAIFAAICIGWSAIFGEMPLRWPVAMLQIAAYAVVIEWWTQGWKGRDSIEDTAFVALGPIAIAASFEEVGFNGWISTLELHNGYLAGFIALAFCLCLAYAIQRLPK
jgi:hypothetical protein